MKEGGVEGGGAGGDILMLHLLKVFTLLHGTLLV